MHWEWKCSWISICYWCLVNVGNKNKGQCTKKWFVDSTLRPQEQRGFREFWKPYLNLCSCKWLRTKQILVTNLIPFELSQLKKLFAVDLMKFKIPFLKTGKLLLLWKLEFSLFNSVTDEGMNEFLKKLCLNLEKGDFHYCHKKLHLLFCSSPKTSSALT